MARYRSWFPLAVAAAMLLLGLLPMVSAPGALLRMSVYQLPAGALLLFLLLPATLAVIWALDRWQRDFARFTKFVLTGAAVLQIFTLSVLLRVAGEMLEETIIAMQMTPEFVRQSLGAGFFLLLGLSALLFVVCGLQLVDLGLKRREASQVPAMQP